MRLVLALAALLTASPSALSQQLQELEARRLALATQIDQGRLPLEEGAGQALLAEAQANPAAEAWYRRELEALVQDQLAIAALDETQRQELVDALRTMPDPRADLEGALQALAASAEHIGGVLGEHHPSVSQRLFYLSNIASQFGRWEDSIEYARRSLAHARALGDRPAQVALRAMWLGWILRRIPEFEESEQLLLEAHGLLRERRSRELGVFVDPSLHVINYLGSLYTDLGRLAEAEDFLIDYVESVRAHNGPQSVQFLAGLNNLGLLLRQRGALDAAVAIQSECVAQAVGVVPEGNPWLAQVWLNLGAVCSDAGRLADAEEALNRSLELSMSLSMHQEFVARAKVILARVAMLGGDMQEAARMAEAALAASEAMEFELESDRSQLVESLLWAAARSGDLERAEQALEEYVSMEQGPTPGRKQLYRGLIETSRRNWERAQPLLEESTRLLEEEQVEGSISRATAHALLAQTNRAQGDVAKAREELQEAARHYEASRSQLGSGFGRSRFQYSPYLRLAAVEAELEGGSAAWKVLESNSSRSLRELIGQASQLRRSPLERELVAIQQQRQVLQAAAEPDGVEQGRLAQLRQRELALRAELAVASQDVQAPQPDLGAAQAALRAGEAYVGWFGCRWGQEASWFAWVLKREGEPLFVALEPEASAGLEEGMNGLGRLLESEAQSVFAPDPGSAQEAAQRLGAWLFDPLLRSSALDDLEHLVLLPSGLEGVPLGALQVDGDWVADRWSLSYAPSCELHVVLRDQAPREAEQRRALVVADPPFQPEHLEQEAGLAQASIAPSQLLLRSGRELHELDRLPQSGVEARTIAGLFEGSTLLTGPEASEASLAQLARGDRLADFSILHFASHAMVDAKDPRRSGIALSQVDLPDAYAAALRGESAADGFVSVPEVVTGWRLDADLVTLSACRSALGSRVRGEGHIGLATAFLRAGARSLVASLWNVQDEPTRLFMESFYRHWKTLDGPRAKARAMERARLELRDFERDGERPYAHPAYWSAFVLIGNPD